MALKVLICLQCIAVVVGVFKTSYHLSFKDSGSILQAVPLGPGRWAEVEEMTIKLRGDRVIFDGMQALCVAMTPQSPTSPLTAGWCEFKDHDGDVTYEHYTGTITDKGGEGRGQFANGTGKFKGLVAEHSWSYHFTWKSDEAYEGVGSKDGRYWFTDHDEEDDDEEDSDDDDEL